MRTRGVGGHQRAYQGRTEDWLTPLWLLRCLGKFDLDPCAPVRRPWAVARRHLTVQDDGLTAPWRGRVFLNPPYGAAISAWMAKMAAHRNGIALVFARTETEWFHDSVWPVARAVLFLKGRLSFCLPCGRVSNNNAGGPSALVAYAERDVAALRDSGLDGHLCVLSRR